MCGFIGVVAPDAAAPVIALGLQAMQHRGQDAAGLGTFHEGRFHLHKDLGLVSQVLGGQVLQSLPGNFGIGHVRYPTMGTGQREDAQPFLTRRPGILMSHNGNVTNVPQLSEELLHRGLHVLSQCDCEPILLTLADELTRIRPARHSIDDLQMALGMVLSRVHGAYSAACVLTVDNEPTLVAFRDSHAIRPAVYGRREDGAWMVASESVALDVAGFELVGHLRPGSMAVFRAGREPVLRDVRPAAVRHCVFERIYFARPDSMMEDGRVNQLRWRLGRRLAESWRERGLQADIVVAVPDTSRPAAQAMAEELGLPHREGFIKNRYSGRTFIMPDQATRDFALRLKLNPIREMFEGKRVILVDDSIVRGSTMRRIVRMIKTLNPVEIHLAIFSPPVRHPCFYGIDMPSEAELIAAGTPNGELEVMLRDHFGVDSVTYMPIAGLEEVAGPHICSACFTGDYPVELTPSERAWIVQDRRPTS